MNNPWLHHVCQGSYKNFADPDIHTTSNLDQRRKDKICHGRIPWSETEVRLHFSSNGYIFSYVVTQSQSPRKIGFKSEDKLNSYAFGWEVSCYQPPTREERVH
jgi:hypothetical protein